MRAGGTWTMCIWAEVQLGASLQRELDNGSEADLDQSPETDAWVYSENAARFLGPLAFM